MKPLALAPILGFAAIFAAHAQTSYRAPTAVGTAGVAWNYPVWNNTADGPYGASYIANNNVSFTSGTYSISGLTTNTSTAVIDVGNITVMDNVTVRVSSAGNQGVFGTGGKVRTLTVGSGAILDFNSVIFNSSTATPTGFIKEGAGVLGLSAITDAFRGGFVLNAGTAVARQTNSFGSFGSSFLTLNGGVVASSTTLVFISAKFPGGITIGGDVQLGELATKVSIASSTANLTFANNVTLGGASRTLTVGNHGVQTFSGILSGSPGVGLTVAQAAGATGSLALSGANTFNGTTRVLAGATLTLANALAVQNSAIDTAGAGTVAFGAPTAFTLGGLLNASGAATSLNASGKALTLNSTAVSSISIPTVGSFSSGAAITVSATSFDLAGGLGVALGGTYAEGGYFYDLIDGNTAGAFGSVSLTGAFTALLNADNLYTATDATGNRFSFDNASGVLSITAIPEPQEYALGVGGLVAFAVWARRRRAAISSGARAGTVPVALCGGIG